jgi:hypothetical protein
VVAISTTSSQTEVWPKDEDLSRFRSPKRNAETLLLKDLSDLGLMDGNAPEALQYGRAGPSVPSAEHDILTAAVPRPCVGMDISSVGEASAMTAHIQ